MNIILNSYCNLKCNYCFADEYMEETVRTPGKSMDFDYFINELLPRIKNTPVINFMGGEPTLHPKFNEILNMTLDNIQPFSTVGVFTNGLMPDKVLDLMQQLVGPGGSMSDNINFAVLLNLQTLENITEKNHQRTLEVAETLLSSNGYSVTFSLNLYSVEQDLARQCSEIDTIYQKKTSVGIADTKHSPKENPRRNIEIQRICQEESPLNIPDNVGSSGKLPS